MAKSSFQIALENVKRMALKDTPGATGLDYVHDSYGTVKAAIEEAQDALEETVMKLFPMAEDMKTWWNHGNHQLLMSVQIMVDGISLGIRIDCRPLKMEQWNTMLALAMAWPDEHDYSVENHPGNMALEATTTCESYTMEAFKYAKNELYAQMPNMLKALKRSAERNALAHQSVANDSDGMDNDEMMVLMDRRLAHATQYANRYSILKRFMKRQGINGV